VSRTIKWMSPLAISNVIPATYSACLISCVLLDKKLRGDRERERTEYPTVETTLKLSPSGLKTSNFARKIPCDAQR